MEKRTIVFGNYHTASHGWTLCALEFAEPIQITNLVQVFGRVKGPLDLSTALTDGEPIYDSRPLSATLETSEGDRMTRERRISHMVNLLHGRRVNIVLPDHPNHYAVGSLAVKRLYNDLAHGSVQVTGTCEPWLYAREETTVTLQATETQQTTTIINQGVMPLVPLLRVEGGSVNLTYGSSSVAMDAGSYEWPDLYMTPGEHMITYQGAGTLTITYREAVLR